MKIALGWIRIEINLVFRLILVRKVGLIVAATTITVVCLNNNFLPICWQRRCFTGAVVKAGRSGSAMGSIGSNALRA